MKGLLVASFVLCAMGIAALGLAKLVAWAAPQPVSAAPSQVDPATPAATVPPTPVQPTATAVAPKPMAETVVEPPVLEPITATAVISDPIALETTEYVVVAGDTLATVATRHGLSVSDLVATNDLDDPNLLFVGQMLKIPATGQGLEPEADAPVEESPEPLPEAENVPVDLQSEERWIDVDLSEQRVTAYEGSTAVHTTLASTGLPQTPTPEGQYRIWIKLRLDDMAGADYYIEDVPFVMYFHEGYGLHGVTWHGNFGHPMSHGCVNLPTPEAEWLFNWAEVGTLVNVHA
jgi:lipoprotein-anchoring transpeptidase ErfK/SrfK